MFRWRPGRLRALLLGSVLLTACSGGPPASTPTPGAPTAEPTPVTYDDPFAYCAAVETIDAPDARYAGPAVPEVLVEGVAEAAGIPEDSEHRETPPETLAWRCHHGRVFVCTFTPNLPCARANAEEQPTVEMNEYCADEHDGVPVPASVSGHDTIHGWLCEAGQARSVARIYDLDDRGFVAGFWHEVRPRG